MSRVALVTGGTRGIGEAISLRLKDEGYKVAASYVSRDEDAQKFMKKTGVRVYKFDVAIFDQCSEKIKEIEKDLGPIEVLINNAGVTRDSMLHKMDVRQWGDVIRTNLDSCFNMSKCVIDSMREKGFGRIINISSVNGQVGQAGQTNYSATKAGMIGFTKSLALDFSKYGIRVNCIGPGYFTTKMTEKSWNDKKKRKQRENRTVMKRWGIARDLHGAVVFLSSDASSYITGQDIYIDGGLLIKGID